MSLWPRSALAIKALSQPTVLLKAALRRFPLGSFPFRLALDAFPRPWYAYGALYAAELAYRLELPAVSLIEFGVAGGDGLVELERMAAEVERVVPVKVHVFGFDTGSGLPAACDYRDLPYVWRKGLYQMNVSQVKSRLNRAELVLGHVGDSVPAFLSTPLPAPVGFIAFDLDYYSSTVDAFRIFSGPDASLLPRVLCYFDDVQSIAHLYHSEDVGELLAIREFNDASGTHHKIRPPHGLAQSLPLEPSWAESLYVYHRYDHALYDTYIGTGKLTS